jgi:hypothetical protein
MKKYRLIFLLSLLLLQTGCGETVSSQKVPQQTPEKVENKVENTAEKAKKYTHLRLPYASAQEPVLIGADLYVAVNEDSPASTNLIIRHNLNTKKTANVFKSQFEKGMIHTVVGNKDWLVWMDADEMMVKNKIWAKNLKTGAIKLLAESKVERVPLGSPALYGDDVAWIDVDEKKQATIQLLNLKTDKKRAVHRLHRYHLENSRLCMNEGKLVWSDEINQVSHYMVYDLSNHQIQSYKAPGYFPSNVNLVGNQLFSINSTRQMIDFHTAWTGVFDPKTGKSSQLSDHFPHQLTGFGNYIAYVDDGIKDIKQKLQVFKVEAGQLKKVIVDTHLLYHPDFFSASSGDVLLIYCPFFKDGKNIATDLLIVQL